MYLIHPLHDSISRSRMISACPLFHSILYWSLTCTPTNTHSHTHTITYLPNWLSAHVLGAHKHLQCIPANTSFGDGRPSSRHSLRNCLEPTNVYKCSEQLIFFSPFCLVKLARLLSAIFCCGWRRRDVGECKMKQLWCSKCLAGWRPWDPHSTGLYKHWSSGICIAWRASVADQPLCRVLPWFQTPASGHVATGERSLRGGDCRVNAPVRGKVASFRRKIV